MATDVGRRELSVLGGEPCGPSRRALSQRIKYGASACCPRAISVGDGDETERGIAGFANRPDGGLIILPHPGNINHRASLIELPARLVCQRSIPFRYFNVATGSGLVSCGFD
jgi:hypothetical protein